jgi:hypothetical protein
MPRCPASGAGSGAEFRSGLARVGWLEDLASGAFARIIPRRFVWAGAAWTIGQGFRAVHFVEVGVVDAGGADSTARGMPLSPQGQGEG